MKRRTTGATIALSVAVAVTACGPDAIETTTRPATPVRMIEAEPSTTVEPIRASGIVASRAELDLTFKIPGYIEEILVEEGDRVSEGQVLARLQMAEADARVRAATARAELASKSLGRLERLFADSLIAEARLDEARDANERAQAGLELARFDQLHATIRAPSDGRILGRDADVSELTGPGTPVFRFGSTASGWVVRVGVPDHQVLRIALGGRAAVTSRALGHEPLVGTISKISDAADPRSGTFEVEVAVRADGSGLRSGMVAAVEIESATSRPVVYLPPVSVVDAEGTSAAVFIVADGTARRHRVEIVTIGDDAIGVAPDGLTGARVVTDGAAYLRDGDRVTPATY